MLLSGQLASSQILENNPETIFDLTALRFQVKLKNVSKKINVAGN